ncbi:MAG TPA: hypothetical protein VLT87_11520 [Thermoanaerobaculia bacterium]|nr:hypothetical protein [Thermoanaerobaculia bacterium]
MSDSDLDVDVRLVECSEVVEETEVRVPNPLDDVLEHALGAQIVPRPTEGYAIRLEKVDEVEAQRPFEILQEPVPHEAPEIARLPRIETRETLQERKFVPVGLPKVDDAKAAIAVELDGIGRALVELPEEVGEASVPAEPGEIVVVLICRDETVDEATFEKAGKELSDEDFRFRRMAHAQSSA